MYVRYSGCSENEGDSIKIISSDCYLVVSLRLRVRGASFVVHSSELTRPPPIRTTPRPSSLYRSRPSFAVRGGVERYPLLKGIRETGERGWKRRGSHTLLIGPTPISVAPDTGEEPIPLRYIKTRPNRP